MKLWMIMLSMVAWWSAAELVPRSELVVGTREIPPFAMRDEAGQWFGITIDLWAAVATKLDVSYRYEPLALTAMFEGLQNGTLDVAAAALSITSEREAIVDFSHPFYQTGLGIAVAGRPVSPWLIVVRRLFSWQFIRVLAVLSIILSIFGCLIWLFERRGNRTQFAGSPARGIGAGFWWSAVTMTTVGYGDKAPVTLGGRFVALIWMFSGIIIISSITAAITSALTVASLDTAIRSPGDLHRVRVATISNTTSAEHLSERGIHPQLYDTLDEALEALVAGEVGAVVYDAPLLAYRINESHPGRLVVLAETFDRQQYGLALPYDGPLRQTINRALLELLEQGEVERLKKRYLGE